MIWQGTKDVERCIRWVSDEGILRTAEELGKGLWSGRSEQGTERNSERRGWECGWRSRLWHSHHHNPVMTRKSPLPHKIYSGTYPLQVVLLSQDNRPFAVASYENAIRLLIWLSARKRMCISNSSFRHPQRICDLCHMRRKKTTLELVHCYQSLWEKKKQKQITELVPIQ